MTPTLERLARAIAELESPDPETWPHYLPHVRAILQAMREPPDDELAVLEPAMTLALCRAWPWLACHLAGKPCPPWPDEATTTAGAYECPPEPLVAAWQAGIDAILSPGTGGEG